MWEWQSAKTFIRNFTDIGHVTKCGSPLVLIWWRGKKREVGYRDWCVKPLIHRQSKDSPQRVPLL